VSGPTSDTHYDLFFTPTRLIAAIVLRPSDFSQIYAKRASWVEIFMGGALQRREIQAFSERIERDRRHGFRQKSVSEILSSHGSNFEICYENVVCVKVNRSLLGVGLEFDLEMGNGFRRRVRFQLRPAQVEQVRAVLNRTMPGKVA
jgi:hypothetical protein